MKLKDICWICSSWQEVYIKIKKTDSSVKECYIHLNCEDYFSIKMTEEEEYF